MCASSPQMSFRAQRGSRPGLHASAVELEGLVDRETGPSPMPGTTGDASWTTVRLRGAAGRRYLAVGEVVGEGGRATVVVGEGGRATVAVAAGRVAVAVGATGAVAVAGGAVAGGAVAAGGGGA